MRQRMLPGHHAVLKDKLTSHIATLQLNRLSQSTLKRRIPKKIQVLSVTQIGNFKTSETSQNRRDDNDDKEAQ